MIFAQTTVRNGLVVIDGYSNKKTIKGAIADLVKEVAKINEAEATNLKEYGLELLGTTNETDEYYIECEKVCCATNMTEDDEMEFKDANFYLMIRFVA